MTPAREYLATKDRIIEDIFDMIKAAYPEGLDYSEVDDLCEEIENRMLATLVTDWESGNT